MTMSDHDRDEVIKFLSRAAFYVVWLLVGILVVLIGIWVKV